MLNYRVQRAVGECTAEYRRGEGDGDVGEDGGGVGVDRGDDDGP